jgi:hypothetical protein
MSPYSLDQLMQKYFLVSLVILVSCSRSGSPGLSASETLKQYYAAVNAADTAKAYSLSTPARLEQLKADAAPYFAMCYNRHDSIQIVREKPYGDTESLVYYTDVSYNRASGSKMDSNLVLCTMKKQNGEWKTSLCGVPGGGVTTFDTTMHDLNLGFEQSGLGMRPAGWYAGSGEYELIDLQDYSGTLDADTVHGGKYSLHLKHVLGKGFGVGTGSLGALLPAVRAKTIRLSGWIKTKDVSEFAGLWCRVDGANNEKYAFNNMQDSMITGTHDWKRYSFEMPVDKRATNVSFGVLTVGTGEAWFDDLSIDTNGVLWKN